MSVSTKVSERLDPQAIEERTQAIGRELFAEAKRQSAHLSVLNRWTEQVLSWCLADPTLKGAVLRFIDVLPSLTTPHAIARHVHEYFPTTTLRLPIALRLGSTLARTGLFTAPALSAVIRQLVEQVARQFIAESHPEGIAQVVQHLAAHGATCSVDVLGEQVVSDVEADQYLSRYQTVLRELSRAYAGLPKPATMITCGPLVNLSVKPSALSPRFDPISPTPSIQRAAQRVMALLWQADSHHALINLDMEHYELRDLTLELAKYLLVHPEVGHRASLGVVIQSYLRDAEETVERLLSWLAVHERPLTVRLVKGAYWDYEVAQATARHWPVPVYQEKADTDATFERLTRRLLSAHPLVTTAIASHNIRSIAHAMAAAETLGLAKAHVEFQLLYGMGDAIRAAIIAHGYPVRVYTPVGELIPGMAYLVRRLLENTSNDSFLRQEWLRERSAEELLAPPPAVYRPASLTEPARARLEWTGDSPLDFSKVAERERMAIALTAVKTKLGRTYPLLLADQVVETPEVLSSCNPAHPTEVIGKVSLGGLAEVHHAIQRAQEAQPRWAKLPIKERVVCLRRAAGLIRQRRYELAAWEVFEVGKTWREADADIMETVDYLEYYSQCMMGLAAGKPLFQVPGERNASFYTPRGVAVVIAPWNFPAAILTGMASAALVTGNAVILKPAEQSSVMAFHITQILREAGVPPAVLQCLPGMGHEVGVALVRHPQVHTVLFTGSKVVGLSIIKSCANVGGEQRFIKHVVAEMGGKNAIIVDENTDLDAAIQGTMVSAFGYAGQKCSAASRLIVHEAVYDRLLARLTAAVDRLSVGDPADPDTDLGPLINEEAQRRLSDAIAHAGEVAHVAYRYPVSRLPPRGYFVGPVILTDVPRRHTLAKEELFGPLLCVFRVKHVEEALALANATDYGLTGGIYSRSPSRIAQAVEAFDVGSLYINRPITGAVVGRQPFGGHRLSGLGTKAGGPDYLLQLLLPKTICENTSRHGIPLD